jgi:hypothetical protein
MSHLTKSSVKIHDIDALETAAKELGGVLVRNQKTYRWYGRFVGDAPLPEGIDKSTLGHCAHVIKVDGAGYDVGVVKMKDGSYTLLHDYWGPGAKLVEVFGDKLSKLAQQYSKTVTIKQARKHGYSVLQKVTPSGAIKMQLVQL